MQNKEAFVIIANACLVHLIFTFDVPSFMINNEGSAYIATAINLSIGISLLLFPVFGIIADVYLTRYRMLRLSLLMLVSIQIVVLIFGMVTIAIFPSSQQKNLSLIADTILVVGANTCLGIFEANALQFGMDQLLDASSIQLSMFVHWYFWATHLGQQVLFLINFIMNWIRSITYNYHELVTNEDMHLLGLVLYVVFGLVWMCSLAVCCLLFHRIKNHLYIAKAGMNPFKLMWNVLKFAWNNKYPLNRSAFTYCENNIPSRLDLGKEQYGGPFTTEEVEDVKTFFRLFLLLVTLFGYHISGDGFSISHFVQKYSCPSSNFMGFVAYNPSCVSSTIVLLGIPLVKCLPKVHRLIPNMLKRIGLGLLVLVAQDIIYTIIIALQVNNEAAKDANNTISGFHGTYLYCYDFKTHDNRKGFLSINDTFLWLIVPQILNGLGQLLVHMTTLEFICAQAPRTMQGLLIGSWYAMFSIRYTLINSFNYMFSSWLDILIYQATRCGLILVSLSLYLCVSRAYQYRMRDWVVHVQWMVEDVFERRMEQGERYWRKKEAEQHFETDSSSSDPDEQDNLLT